MSFFLLLNTKDIYIKNVTKQVMLATDMGEKIWKSPATFQLPKFVKIAYFTHTGLE